MRIALIILGLLIVFVGLPAAGIGAYFLRFYGPVATANYPAPQDAIEARLQDIDFLSRLSEFDHSFSEDEEVELAAHLATMRDTAGNMSDAEFYLAVARAAGITENGHTNLYVRTTFNRFANLPVRFFWFGDGLHIIRARTEQADLIGARVLSYNGIPPEDLLPIIEPYVGGNFAYLRYESPTYFAVPTIIHTLTGSDPSHQVTMTLMFPDGRTEDVTLSTTQDSTPLLSVDDSPLAAPARQETESGHDWAFLDGGAVAGAHYGRHPEQAFWHDALPYSGHYVRMRQTYGALEDGTPLSSWLGTVRAQLLESPVAYIVLDLRSNGGGDLTLAMDFARNITDLITPDGHVYILTDGGTFSAAIVTAAYARHSGGARSTIMGEEIGDFEQFWAEGGGPMVLPNSELRIGITTGYHDWENGCTSWTQCYWISAAMGVAAGPLTPDQIVPLTFEDYSGGVDPAIEAILAIQSD